MLLFGNVGGLLGSLISAASDHQGSRNRNDDDVSSVVH